MAGKKFTEPIEIRNYGTTADGAGGLIPSGEVTLDTTNATITQKLGSYFADGVRQSYQGSYEVELWANPNYTITENCFVFWRSKKLVIQGVNYSDDFLKVTLRCNAQ